MKIHHLNCATMCARGARLMTGTGGWLQPCDLVAHCLLIEAGDGLVLVDTGLGEADCGTPHRIPLHLRALIRPVCDVSEAAVRQIRALGLDPADVRHVITTHLDFDHAGGLSDFPSAKVHVFGDELQAALKPPLSQRARYVPAHFAHGPDWVEHRVNGDDWFGFQSVRLLPDVDGEIVLVPLLGHSTGHSGVAIRDGGGWLLHCGDAFIHPGEVTTPPSEPRGVRIYQRLVEQDGAKRRHNLERLRELSREHGDEVRMFCSHDRGQLERELARSRG